MAVIKDGFMQTDVPLKTLTTWNVGGISKQFFAPTSVEQITKILPQLLKNNDICYILGGGSNVLISDEAINEPLIYTPQMNNFEVIRTQHDMTYIRVDAGCNVAKIRRFAYNNSLTGLEFLTGIPGTVGGALWGNAGAAGKDLSQVLIRLQVILKNGEIVTVENSDMKWSYRKSPFIDSDVSAITNAVIALKETHIDEIKEKTLIFAKLKHGQPMARKTAGCVFKNPEGDSAGRLLDISGCKGMKYGGAVVSEAHANFIENSNNATSLDIYKLCEKCRKRVYEEHGVELEYEIRMFGKFQ